MFNKNKLNIVNLLILCHSLGLLINVCKGIEINYNNPVVQTAYGPVQGRPYQYSTTGTAPPKQVVAFIGIPYARPPTGYDRFNAPRNPEPWTTPVDATNRRVMCPQVEDRFEYTLTEDIVESEDCLQLNIYTPVYQNQFQANLPVLVYFHGGEFKYGGKDFVKPDILLETSMVDSQGMIVITVNYRLGVLGFISTDDANIPGNNGIRDQVQALRWVSENIGAFNGNSQNITIMGHDAGAISVSIHVLNQEAWPYFNAAISIGGTVFTPWAFKDNPKDQAMNFGSFFGCDMRSDQLLECLRNQDRSALMGKSRDRDLDRNVQPYWFRPVVDRNLTAAAVIKDWPIQLYQNSQFKKCSYIIGFTRDEGSMEYYLQKQRADQRLTNEEKIAFLIRPFLKEWASEDIIAAAINYQYFGRNYSRQSLNNQFIQGNGQNNRLLNGQLNRLPMNQQYQPQGLNNYQTGYANGGLESQNDRLLVELLGDFLYIAPSDYVARLHSERGGHVWLYAFEYEGTRSFGPLQKNAMKVSKTTYGVTHMDDLFFALINEYIRDQPANERQLSNTYARMFTTLTRWGTIPQSYVSYYQWKEYTAHSPSYLLFPRGSYTPIPVTARNSLDGYRTTQADFFNTFIMPLQDKTKIYPSPFPYSEFKGYRAATWSLFGFAVLLMVLLIVVIAVLCIRSRNDSELKLLRKSDKEMEERFNTTSYESERL